MSAITRFLIKSASVFGLIERSFEKVWRVSHHWLSITLERINDLITALKPFCEIT